MEKSNIIMLKKKLNGKGKRTKMKQNENWKKQAQLLLRQLALRWDQC